MAASVQASYSATSDRSFSFSTHKNEAHKEEKEQKKWSENTASHT
ncbi:hypothetical protein [Veronia nyctiphanis]|nr:hypothetical protein [Veronia nyctiphanis]